MCSVESCANTLAASSEVEVEVEILPQDYPNSKDNCIPACVRAIAGIHSWGCINELGKSRDNVDRNLNTQPKQVSRPRACIARWSTQYCWPVEKPSDGEDRRHPKTPLSIQRRRVIVHYQCASYCITDLRTATFVNGSTIGCERWQRRDDGDVNSWRGTGAVAGAC